jgi:hypothetical protein
MVDLGLYSNEKDQGYQAVNSSINIHASFWSVSNWWSITDAAWWRVGAAATANATSP